MNIKKYSGTIVETNKKIIIKYKTKGRVFIVKEFIKDGNNTMKEAINYKKRWAIVNNLVKNKYEVIEEGNDKYIKVYIKDDIQFLIDFDDANYIEKYNWTYGNGFKYIKTIDSTTKKKIAYHQLKLGYTNVIHGNNNIFDNRSYNLLYDDKNNTITDKNINTSNIIHVL